MEIKFSKDNIELEKELNYLDHLVIKFCSNLNKLNIKYVIVSGYVSIVFGRSRSSEDIDILVEKLSIKKFKELWGILKNEFECLNTIDFEDAFNNYVSKKTALRFALFNTAIPNMEFKFVQTELDFWVLNNRLKLILNKNELYISQIELQICFKLSLGSNKDIEDAKHLYLLFKDKLNKETFLYFLKQLKQEKNFNLLK